jgi:serine/threonine protein kinase
MDGPLHWLNPETQVYHGRFCWIEENTFCISRFEDHSGEVIRIPIIQDQTHIIAQQDPLAFAVTSEPLGHFEFRAASRKARDSWVFALRVWDSSKSEHYLAELRFIQVLGRGFYGKVTLVEHLPTQKLYALKTIHKRRLVELCQVSTVQEERNLLRTLDPCPFIVNLCFAFQTDVKFYLGLEYAPGGELLEYLKGLPVLAIEDTRLYIAEIILALNHLHTRGIVYRDLKPENILLSKEGHVKLTDFGLSKSMKTPTGCVSSLSTMCGTTEYLAPEIIRGEEYGVEVDFWALGVVFFEILFGDTPFYGEDAQIVFERILHEEPEYPKFGHPGAIDLMKKLLVKDPGNRIGFEGITKHKFFHGTDWEKVARCEVKPKSFQEVGNELEPENFSSSFANEPPDDSLISPKTQIYLDGFSFGSLNSPGRCGSDH